MERGVNKQTVAVSRGYDTYFSAKACDGLCQLLKSHWIGLKHHKGFNQSCGPLSDTL